MRAYLISVTSSGTPKRRYYDFYGSPLPASRTNWAHDVSDARCMDYHTAQTIVHELRSDPFITSFSFDVVPSHDNISLFIGQKQHVSPTSA
jgi:hypothetical protein